MTRRKKSQGPPPPEPPVSIPVYPPAVPTAGWWTDPYRPGLNPDKPGWSAEGPLCQRFHDGKKWTGFIAYRVHPSRNPTGWSEVGWDAEPLSGPAPKLGKRGLEDYEFLPEHPYFPDDPPDPPTAGWWRDPFRVSSQRYHDGIRWTQYCFRQTQSGGFIHESPVPDPPASNDEDLSQHDDASSTPDGGAGAYAGYLYEPIPSPRDEELQRLVEAYRHAGRDKRSSVRKGLDRETVEDLESFAERQAVAAVRTGTTEPIGLGLLALGLSYATGDRPQAVMALTKLDHSARMLGMDLGEVASVVTEVLPEDARYAIAKFLAREDRDDTLLQRMGFAAYGSGARFVYDNVLDDGRGTTPPGGAHFLIRQRYHKTKPFDPVSIRVKEGCIVATDHHARRAVYPLHEPGAPQRVVRYFARRGRSGVACHWAVVDAHGYAVLSGAEDDWTAEDFEHLADAAGLEFAPEALAPGYTAPRRRPDAVDFTQKETSNWIMVPLLFLGLIMLPVAVVNLWAGRPWLWAIYWSAVGGLWWIPGRARTHAALSRNLPLLPPDEPPAGTRPHYNLGRAVLSLAAFALGPSALAYQLTSP